MSTFSYAEVSRTSTVTICSPTPTPHPTPRAHTHARTHTGHSTFALQHSEHVVWPSRHARLAFNPSQLYFSGELMSRQFELCVRSVSVCHVYAPHPKEPVSNSCMVVPQREEPHELCHPQLLGSAWLCPQACLRGKGLVRSTARPLPVQHERHSIHSCLTIHPISIILLVLT